MAEVFTREDLKHLAREHIPVAVRYRNSTEACEGLGYIVGLSEEYQNGELYEVVTVKDLHANSVMRVRPCDVIRVADEVMVGRGAGRAERSEGMVYEVLGAIGNSSCYNVLGYLNGAKAALYKGFVDEERDKMRLVIQRPYMRGVPPKDEVALRLLRRA